MLKSLSCALLLHSVTGMAQSHAPWQPRALWIAGPDPAPLAPLPLFRTQFTLVTPAPTKATLTIAGLGLYEAHINGQNVTHALLTPGLADYRKRAFYNTYDVTALLHPGPNALGILLGYGMFNVEKYPGRYAKFVTPYAQPRLIAELDLTFADGSHQLISSGPDWRTTPGPILVSSPYGGEDFDARRQPVNWDSAPFNDASWAHAVPLPTPLQLTLETNPPVQPFESFAPIKVTHPKPGVDIYDLGQNFQGWPELEATGTPGATIKLIPGELLDAAGFVTQHSANAASNKQISYSYTLAGGAPERWHPRFSTTGFRFLQVEIHGEATVQHLAGRFLHDAVPLDGTFHASNPLLEQIHALITRAMLSNMVSVLTDCPQREKLGWLEQTHLGAASLMYNFGLQSLYATLSLNMQDAQLPSGFVPNIAPEYSIFGGDYRDSPEWGAAVVLAPWAAYQFYGDPTPLRLHYASMQAYAAYLHSRLDPQSHLIVYGLGDWYDIGPRPTPGRSQLTSPGVTASAIYFDLLNALARISTLLGHPQDAATYAAQADTLRTAYNARFFHPETNRYDNGSQTDYAMPLAVGLVPAGHAPAVLANLIADIHAHTDHVTAGEIGFHYVVRVLTDYDQPDILYAMVTRPDAPSYASQLARGATALTEAWDANPAESQNHFMLGHAEEWFYRGLAGIDFDLSRPEPATRIRIHPAIPSSFASASASATFHSHLGDIASAWHRSGSTLTLDITVPVAATVVFPAAYTHMIKLDSRNLAPGTTGQRIPAGTHHFTLN